MTAPTFGRESEARRLIDSALDGARLPRWSTPVIAAVALTTAGLLNLTGPVSGIIATLVTAAAFYVTIQSTWSFAVEGRRHAVDRLATTAVYATFVIALAPLVSVLLTVLVKGAGVISATFLTTSMRGSDTNAPGGGLYHAIIGTLQQVGIAALVAIPLGILTAIYLVEYGKQSSSRLPRFISFFVDVMTGVPSIVMGLFVYTALILTLGFERSGFAAAIALALLMIPVVVRSSEEMLTIVPRDLREASYALGVPKWRTITRIVVPTALSGIITGSMLAIARAAGETAPLLLTTFVAQQINTNPFANPQTSLPLFIWDQIGNGTGPSTDRAWGGALVLVALVMIVYLVAKILARLTGAKR